MQRGQDLGRIRKRVVGLATCTGLRWEKAAVPITLASSVARTSSSKDWRACEISGLMEASVRERKSVP